MNIYTEGWDGLDGYRMTSSILCVDAGNGVKASELSAWETETGGSGVQGLCPLHQQPVLKTKAR